MKYFTLTPETLEELKSMYRKLAMKHHPDLGGDTETMKLINNEYDRLFDLVKNLHKNQAGETYSKDTSEAADHFKDIISALLRLRMQGVDIELIGCFLWISGNTKPYKDDIKALGFKWSTNKLSWYKSPDGYRKTSKRDWTLKDIRDAFGSEPVKEREGASAIPA